MSFQTYARNVKLPAGSSLHFQSGRGYYAAPRVAPLTDAQVAQRQVKTAFDPILSQLTNQYNQRGLAEGQAITGSTDELAKLMGSYGPTVGAAYDEAAGNNAAIDAALAAVRQGQGADAQAALAGKLNGIDSGTAARVNGGLTGDLAGEATADATKGASNLAMLLSQGASAKDFGAKLPGVAGGIGLRAQEQTQGQITNDLNTQLQSLYAQEPKAVQDALAAIQTNRSRNAQLKFENDLKNKEYGLASTRANTSATQGAQRIGIEQQNANTSAARAANAQANSDRSYKLAVQRLNKTDAPRANASLSKSLGYLVDASGNPILHGGKRVVVAGASKGVSTTDQRWDAKALAGARSAHAGTTDSKGVYHPPISWQQFLTEGLGEGIPASHLIKQGHRVYSQAEIHQGLIPKPPAGH